MDSAKSIITCLQLQPHPEGGYYRETYRDTETITLPDGRVRNLSTAIHYLLVENNKSHFHRIQSDEIWFFHSGKPLSIYQIEPNGIFTIHTLGSDIMNGQKLQVVIPAHSWFAAKIIDDSGYTLVSCTVSPGFDFLDFEVANKNQLLQQYPEHSGIIEEMCYSNL